MGTFRCWSLLGPTRLEARGSRGAQGDGEQGTQQWPPGNVRRCGRHNARAADGQGFSLSRVVSQNISSVLSLLLFWRRSFPYARIEKQIRMEGSCASSTFYTAQCLFMACQHI